MSATLTNRVLDSLTEGFGLAEMEYPSLIDIQTQIYTFYINTDKQIYFNM